MLEPLAGYLQLAEQRLTREGNKFSNAWKFGPDASGDATVGEVAETTARLWGDSARVVHAASAQNPREAGLLRLDSTSVRTELAWKPRWSLQQALEHTVAWHRAWKRGADMTHISLDQIHEYEVASQS